MATAIGQYILCCGQCGYVLCQVEPKYVDGKRVSVPQAFVSCMNVDCENHGKRFRVPYAELELFEVNENPPSS